MSSRVCLATGVVVEEMGRDLVVMVPGSLEVVILSGYAAGVVRDIQAGAIVRPSDLVSQLVRAGVLETSGLSRRGFITAGTVGAGLGIAAITMPGVAAASSENVDFVGMWTRLYNPGQNGAPDTVIGVTFLFDSKSRLAPLPTLRIDGAGVSLDGDETDWVDFDAEMLNLGLPQTGRTDFSYSFESSFPITGNDVDTGDNVYGNTLEPNDAVFRTLVDQLIAGTAGGAVFGTLTIGTDTFRVRFDFEP